MEAPQESIRTVSATAQPSAADAARARAQAYGLFSRLVLNGVEPSTAALLRDLPVLRDALAADADPDELAAAHHALFTMQLFPYESVFLDASGQPGGTTTESVADFHRQAGFALRFDDVTVDHLGAELAFLSFMSSAEADAVRDHELRAAEQCRDLSRAYIKRHLGAWLAPLAASAAVQTPTFWTTLIELIAELASDHASSLAITFEDDAPGENALLDDPDTDLRRIAEHLCRPTSAGILLTREDLSAIGRRLSIPTGFGTRAQRMQCLLESASQYDSLTALCQALEATASSHLDRYRAFDPFGQPWIARAGATRDLLRRLADVAHSKTMEATP